MEPKFNFTLFQPKRRLSNEIQGVWSASVSPQSEKSVQRWLHSDACSGILFIFDREINLNEVLLPQGVYLLPVSKQAQLIALPPGAKLMGVRFHPGVSFGIFGTLYQQPTSLKLDVKDDFTADLDSLYWRLATLEGYYAQITALYRWLHKTIIPAKVVPYSLTHALNVLNHHVDVAALNQGVSLSQRQIERQFQQWLSMTPKYYQRLLRVKNTMSTLKQGDTLPLVTIALEQGFTDQAHMTREFKHIARITPKEYRKRVSLIAGD